VRDDGTEAGAWLTATNKSCDIAFTKDHTGVAGRFHHLTYAARPGGLKTVDSLQAHGAPPIGGPALTEPDAAAARGSPDPPPYAHGQ